MSSTFTKLLATHLTEGAGLISEYWVIGLMHEIGRHAIYFNGNVNKPEVGYFITVMFSLFYLGRICGNLFGVGFAKKKRSVFFTYITFIPLIVATYFQSLYTGALWIFASRILIGFFSGFSPAMCMLRSDVKKTQLISFIEEAKRKLEEEKARNGDDRNITRVKASTKQTKLGPFVLNMIEFFCSFGALGLSSLVYNFEALDIVMPTIVFTVIIFIFFVIFVVFFKCSEPKDYEGTPAMRKLKQKQNKESKKNQSVLRGIKRLGFFEFFLEDDDLTLNTLAVTLYEAIRMCDFVFIILMLQTNPYYKGLWIARRPVLIAVFISSFISMFMGQIFAIYVDPGDAAGWMQVVCIASFIIYPLCNTLINLISYKSPNLSLVVFGIFELIKYTMLYIMRDGLHESLKKDYFTTKKDKDGKEVKQYSNNPKEDNFKGIAQFSENVMKFLVFTIFGYLVTKAMASAYIQKMNPYNYTIAFGFLCIPMFGCWLLLSIAIALDDDKSKVGDQE